MRVVRDGNRLRVTFVNELTGDVEVRETDQLVVEYGTTPADQVYKELLDVSVNGGITDMDALVNTATAGLRSATFSHR